MNRDAFIQLLKDPHQLNADSIEALGDIVKDFPWFQSARMLLLLNLYKEKHFRFEEELKTTAIYANDRRILKHNIEQMDRPAQPFVLPDEIASPETTSPDENIRAKKETTTTETKKPEDEKTTRPVEDLIDEFIRNEPSISRPAAKFFSPTEAAKTSVVDEENIVSETLAAIYFDQGRYEKAISVYQKLSLKFPEKSSYFAALILKAKEELKK